MPRRIRLSNVRARRVPLFILIVLCLAAAILIPSVANAGSADTPPGLLPVLDRMIKNDGAPGVTVAVFRHGHLLYRVDAGDIAANTALPVASASKWLTAALVMSVVEDGLLALDEPIGRRLPDFKGAAAAITLRQILSFTSGQGGLAGLVDLRQDPRLSLAESARRIARLPLRDRPGTVFRYGGPALQIAGALVEQATGKTWAQLFEERLGRPLGMTHTAWGNPLWPAMPPSAIHNPNLQGGAVTTADDYGKFLTMLDAGGVYGGRRILSARSVALMEHVQTRGARIAFTPAGAAGAALQYGFGNWCEAVEAGGACSIVSSPGAFGTYPWIDRRHDLYGLFFMRRRLPLVERDIQAARRIIVRAAAGATPHAG